MNNKMDKVANILGVQLDEIFCKIFTIPPHL